MNRWALIRKFPKIAVIAAIWIGSLTIFGLWWVLRKQPQGPSASSPAAAAPAVDDKWLHGLGDRMGRLFMADGDLFDSESGELVREAWLKIVTPSELFFDRANNRLLGRFERGITSYGLDGQRLATLSERHGVNISPDFKTAFFARSCDMWRAELDLSKLMLVNERQVTKLGNLNEPFMMQNVLLGSENFLVLKNQNQLLRINTSTGEVTPTKVPLTELKKGRSPDGAVLMGDFSEREGRKVFAYDVEKDEALAENVGRSGVNDYAWLGNDLCLMLVGGDSLISFDRKAGKFEALMKLPFPCQRLGGGSPDGRYLFAQSRRGTLLIDAKEKGMEIFQESAQQMEWITDNSMLLASDVPSSELRGTWFKEVGKDAVRLTPEPFSVTRDGVSAVLVFPEAGGVIFATRDRFFSASTTGEALKELSVLKKPYSRLQVIAAWPPPILPPPADGK